MVKKNNDLNDFAVRLVNTCTDSIVTDGDGELDFEETLYNFAQNIVDEMSEYKQKSLFGCVFHDYDDCYSYLSKNVPMLRYELEKIFLN